MSDKSLQNTIALSHSNSVCECPPCVSTATGLSYDWVSPVTIRTHLNPIKGISGESMSTQGHTLEHGLPTADTPLWLKQLHLEQFLIKASLSGDTSTDNWNIAFHEEFLIYIVTGNRRKIYPWVKGRTADAQNLKDPPGNFQAWWFICF